MRFVSNVIWLTLMLCTTLKPNGKFCVGLTNIEGIECLKCICVYWSRSQLSGNLHYFVLISAQSSDKKKWKYNCEELFKRKLVVYFVLHYSRKRFFRKGVLPELSEIYLIAYALWHGLCVLFHARNWNRKRFLPLIANVLFVSINVTLEKVCVWFFGYPYEAQE